MLQDMVLAAVNEAIRSAQELANRKLGGLTGGLGLAAWAARPARVSRPSATHVVLAARQQADHRARKLPGIGQRTAQRLAFHILRVARAGGARARRGDPGGEGADRPVRGLLQPRRGAALPDLPGRAARPLGDLRRRGAGGRDPDRAHARVPRPLPRARRRAVADRRRRSRGPEDRRAGRARRATASVERGRDRDQPDDHRRGDRLLHRARRCASSSATSRSRASRAACRWAPTSSTRTRSRSARRSPAAALSRPRQRHAAIGRSS